MPFARRRERGGISSASPLVCGKTRRRLVPSQTVLETQNKTASVPNDSIREITWDNLNPGPPYRSGDDFANVKFSPASNDLQGRRRYLPRPETLLPGNTWWEYEGGFVRPNYNILPGFGATLGLNPFVGSTFSSNMALGPTAFNSLKPKLEMGSLAVSLAEMRDVPRMLKTTSKGFHDIWKFFKSSSGGSKSSSWKQTPKKASDQFLNHQFGWRPFLRDYASMLDAYHNSQAWLERLTRQNGKWVKRVKVHKDNVVDTLYQKGETPHGGNIPEFRPWEPTQMDNLIKPYIKNGIAYMSSHEQRFLQYEYTWFEGSFRFYRVEFDVEDRGYNTILGDAKRAQKLYGLVINPSTLYQATPWSWLADWFTGLGDVIDTYTRIATDQLASRYVYIMSHKKNTFRHVTTAHFWDGITTFSWDQEIETKLREYYPHPFGLALNVPLTGRQLAILGALGISRR